MTKNIVLKNAEGTNVTFNVVRQPSGTQSAILYEVNNSVGMNRTGLAKIELSTRVVSGKTQPVTSVTVPYGAVVNGNFVKQGQIADTRSATQPADAPTLARANAAAFAMGLATDEQVKSLFETGLIS